MATFSLELRELRIAVRRTDVTLLGPLNADIEQETLLFVIGQSGSGKTLLARSIAGLLSPSLQAFGEARLRVGSQSDHAHRAVYVPQFASSALPPLQSPMWLINSILQQAFPNERKTLRKAAKYFKQLGFSPSAAALREPSYRLSGGMARRVVLAAALATERPVVIVDEPTIGLDPIQRVDFRTLIVRLMNYGRALIVITHDVSLVRYFEAKILVLENGAIHAIASTSDLERKPSRIVRDLLEIRRKPARWARQPNPIRS